MSKKSIGKKRASGKRKLKNRKISPTTSIWKTKHIKSMGVALVLITIIAFIPSLGNGFVNWDDPSYVTDNPFIQYFHPDNLKVIFTEPLAANYHPLTFVSLSIDYALGGGSPQLFHVTNLFLHVMNTLLVFLLGILLFNRNIIIAFSSALLFGIHPMHVESVAWITERKDVLYTFFFLLGLLAYIRYIKKPNVKHLSFVLVLFICSLLSKPAAVTFPLVLFLFDYWYKRKFDRKVILEKIPFILLSIIITVITILIQSDTAVKDLEEISLFHRLLFGPYGFVVYLFKFLFPHNFSTFYPYPNIENLPSYFYLMPFLSFGILAGFYFLFKKYKTPFFGILFFVLTISITLQIFSFGGAILSERYTYLPYIGLSVSMGWLVFYLVSQKKFSKNLVYSIFGIYSLLLVGSTWQQCKVWKDGETLWSQVIDNASFVTHVGYTNRGKHYKSVGQLDKALADYNTAMSINPDHPATLLALGNLQMETNQLAQALQKFNKILNEEPNNSSALNSRGTVNARMQNYADALIDLNKAIELNPRYLAAYKNRALTYLQMAQYDNARKDFLTCLNYSPQDVDLLNAIGVCHQNLNQHQQAIDYFNQSIILDPNRGTWYYNRGISYNALGQRAAAEADWQRAADLGYNVSPQ